jgi:hypothetical protein
MAALQRASNLSCKTHEFNGTSAGNSTVMYNCMVEHIDNTLLGETHGEPSHMTGYRGQFPYTYLLKLLAYISLITMWVDTWVLYSNGGTSNV